MPRLGERINKSVIFAALMALAMLTVFAPAGWTDWLKGVTQLLVPVQSVLHRLGVSAVRSVRALDKAATETAADELRGEIRTLENQLVFQSGLLDQTRAENSALRALREKYVPRDIRLIPARVVARDIIAERDSVLLSGGATRDVSWHDWVSSRVFLDRGADEGAERHFNVLAREYLIGRVEQVQPYMSRVVLLSDLTSRVMVRVGRLQSGRFAPVDYPCTLRGMGRGRMVIEDVPEQMLADAAAPAGRDARLAVGDLVAAGPEEYGLAAPMIIGRVSGISRDPRKRLVATLEVEPAIRPDELGDVFVVASKPPDSFLGPSSP